MLQRESERLQPGCTGLQPVRTRARLLCATDAPCAPPDSARLGAALATLEAAPAAVVPALAPPTKKKKKKKKKTRGPSSS